MKEIEDKKEIAMSKQPCCWKISLNQRRAEFNISCSFSNKQF
ncbi:hypothetical protein [Francisella noatunensis]|nr:hypothetical protein [Francisella noatunensis]